MAKYVCSICGYVYDEKLGDQKNNIPANTKFEDLDEDFRCPICKASKEQFFKEEAKEEVKLIKPTVDKELSALEISAICSNLAKGCEKQYLFEEQQLFLKLASELKAGYNYADNYNYADLISLINSDLNELYPYANDVASNNKDRGALRALVWSQKVTRILESILNEYQTKGNDFFNKTNVWVCSICGFIYVGEKLPDNCPVCKVPSWKFNLIEEGSYE